MATNLYSDNIVGLRSGGSPALLFTDNGEGDVAVLIGANDRGGSASGDNSLYIRVPGPGGGGRSTFSDSWLDQGVVGVCFSQTTDVGIGVDRPQFKLDVDGSMYASGSSLEYKQNIEDYNATTILNKIANLKPVKYNYKEEYKQYGKHIFADKQIGLIAEEVEKTAPELAVTLNENGKVVVRNVDYEKLNVVLLEGLKNISKRIRDLECLI